MSSFIETDFISWSESHYRLLAEGGTWGVPSCGLVFVKKDGGLVLTARQPWDIGMAISAERLRQIQDDEYGKIVLYFGKAGITVTDGTSD